jgi:uncharacterized protein (DUF362 family)
MDRFVKILPVYSRLEDRNIDFLSKVYLNDEILKTSLKSLFSENLFKNDFLQNKTVLLKPNWVTHSLTATDDICLRTNNEFLLTTLNLILEQKPSQVILGDAPIQSCRWNEVIRNDFYESIKQISQRFNIPVLIKDFRRVTFNPDYNNPQKERNPLTDYLIFDIGKNSLLEPISNNNRAFRVTCYDPKRLAEAHYPGTHKYCITKLLFEADVLISIPKIKTHQKTGITGAIKNIVGLNGDKDFLPHHRVGGTGHGGDCYPGKNIFRRAAEYLEDYANMNQGNFQYWLGHKTGNLLWKLSLPKPVHQIAAGWYGNDTCWRMVLDLNTIAVYGKANGTISQEPQREIFSLCDGIIGGQGDGPLRPDPLPLGIISFSNDSLINDMCMAILMGFDFEKIALLKWAAEISDLKKANIQFSNKRINMHDLKEHSVPAIPPPGWVDYLK